MEHKDLSSLSVGLGSVVFLFVSGGNRVLISRSSFVVSSSDGELTVRRLCSHSLSSSHFHHEVRRIK